MYDMSLAKPPYFGVYGTLKGLIRHTNRGGWTVQCVTEKDSAIGHDFPLPALLSIDSLAIEPTKKSSTLIDRPY